MNEEDRGPEMLEALADAPRFNNWMANTVEPWVGTRVLEIGAGIGNMTRQISPRRKLYIATDYNAEHLAHLKSSFADTPEIRVAKLDAEAMQDFAPFAQQMDTVVCLNVLEHIRDDVGTLARIRTLLQPDGRLILLVPNDPAAFGTLDEAVGHYRRYTPDSLTALLQSQGYRVEKMLHFNRVSRPGWRFTGQVMKAKTLSPLGMRVFDRFVWLWKLIDARLPWPAISIIAIASPAQ